MRLEILFKQIVLFGIENAAEQCPQLFGQRISDVRQFKINLDRAGIR